MILTLFVKAYTADIAWPCVYISTYIANIHKRATLCREDFVNTLPELYVERADPELSASRRGRSSSSSSNHSVEDYEELCKFTIFSTACVQLCMHSAEVCIYRIAPNFRSSIIFVST